jgi:glycosyltransferase 2 family protein
MGTAVRAAITALCFGLIAWQVGPAAILARFANVHVGPLLWVAVLLGAQLMVSAWRWQRIAEHVSRVPVRYLDLCRFLGASNLYGQLLPSTIGGDFVRAAMLARAIGPGAATVSTLVDRMTGLAVLLFLMVALLPLLAWRIVDTSAVLALATVGIAGTACFLGIVLLGDRLPANRLPRVVARLVELTGHLRVALFGRDLAPAVIGGGLLSHFISVVNIFLLARSVDVPLAFIDCLLLVPPALLLTSLPISLAGWGVREGALAGAFALVGAPAADVVTVSILYGLTGPAIGLIYGVVSGFGSESVGVVAKESLEGKPEIESGRDEVMRYYDRIASDWDAAFGEGMNATFLESRWQSIEPLLAPYAGAGHAAELGVGTGVYIPRIAPMFRHITAMDFSQGMLDVLQRKVERLGLGNVRLLRQDVYRMSDIADGSVDCAYGIGLFDNIDAPARVFSEVARILRPGGALVACTSNGGCPWYWLRDRFFGSRHHRTGHYLTAEDARRLAAEAGLRLDAAIHWGTVPPGMRSTVLSRLLRTLERAIVRTRLVRYLAGLTFRAMKPDGI